MIFFLSFELFYRISHLKPLVSTWIDEKNGITSYKLVENDFDIVHNLLEEIR